MQQDNLNHQLVDIWREFADPFGIQKVPLFRSDFRSRGCLFVGLNPSFNERAISIRDFRFDDRAGPDAFDWNDLWWGMTYPDKFISALASHERLVSTPTAREYYRTYFSWFETVQSQLLRDYELSMEWDFLDVFAVRLTSQKLVKTSLFKPSGGLSDFAIAQLRVFWEFLKRVDPRIVIVSNAMASRVLESRLEGFDRSAGCHYLLLPDRKVPVMLGGTMQYGRMDEFSLRRLVWHISDVVGKTVLS